MTNREVTEGSVVSADGTTIAYERSGAGPALILVDPAGAYRERGPLRPLAALLAADFTVYAYDRRGRGASTDTPPYGVEREVDDIAALVTEAGGSAGLYGVSSGALLAIHAAAAGVGIARLALFEPPIGSDEDQPAVGESESAFTAELRGLVDAGRHDDAVVFFHVSIGVPEEMVAGMRDDPSWPLFVSVAPTYVYDSVISDATSLEQVAAVKVPTLVIDSEGSTGDLTGWAAEVVGALPDGEHRSLEGEWHEVDDAILARVLTEFFRR